MRISFLLLLSFFLNTLTAQDTLRVMQYNLLYYGVNTGFCNFDNNNPDVKDAYLRTIIGYVKPDIFTVNEMTKTLSYQQHLRDEVLNEAGYAVYEMSGNPNLAQSSIVNMLYYNSEKLALLSQEVAQTEVRDIDVYRLYHLNDALADGDTIFINCIVGHLKAGSSSSDQQEREVMTENALNYLEEFAPAGNYLFMGDFNFYDSDEAAFQLMINNDHQEFRFYDPVNEIGDWHENADYRHIHSQSTHSATGGCPAGGGMDDRFDFILINQTLYDQAASVAYVEGTYRALGQDGMRLNGSLIDPPNTSLPVYLLDALYGMSDHLPIVLSLEVDAPIGIEDMAQPARLDVRYKNPVKGNLKLRITGEHHGMTEIVLISVSGSIIYSDQLTLDRNNNISIPLDTVPAGMYFLRVEQDHASFSGKVVVIR